jgi:uncharacterized protein (TIGR00730 family)
VAGVPDEATGLTQCDTVAAPSRATGSGSPRAPDRDLEILARPELRPVRLLLDYWKPELGLADHGVRHTIVVFGSTRLLDPEVAHQRLADAELNAARCPEDETALDALRRARCAADQSRYYAIARELGRLVGCSGDGANDHRLLIVTGGGPGAMEAANRGAHDVGAPSIGLNITLPNEQKPNPYLTPELNFAFRYFALRKLHFMQRARALVALPGGYGTFDELFETLCLIQTGKRAPLPVVLVGREFWQRAVDFEFLVERGVLDARELSLFTFAESASEIWAAILGWYTERGRSIFDEKDAIFAEDGP